MVISKKTVDGVATTATKKTKDEMVALAATDAFSKGEYLEFDNAKAFQSGSFKNTNIEGTELKVSLTALKGVTFDVEVWGTFKGYVVNISKGVVTFWVESFTPNATVAPTSIEITGKENVTAGKSTTFKATAVCETPYGNPNGAVTWSVANKDTTVTTPLATIDETGKLTAGETTGFVIVTATSTADDKIKATKEIEIKAAAPVDPNKALAKYSFANNGSSTTAYDSAALNALFATKVDATTENIVTEITDASKVYPGQSKYEAFGLKLGSSSAQGKFTVKTSEAISKVVITGYGWKATDSVSIGGAADQVFGNVYNAANVTAVTLTFTFTSTTTIPVVFTNRGFITTLEFFA